MKNKVQFQKGFSLMDFMKEYGTEEKCRKTLFQWRWPDGFHCSECGSEKSEESSGLPMQQLSPPDFPYQRHHICSH